MKHRHESFRTSRQGLFAGCVLAIAAALGACAGIQQALPSPEAQIAAGAQAGAAATTAATRLLQAQKISVPQAKGYRNMLAAANEALKDADADLRACRGATGSTPQTRPDPCWAKVEDVVRIALENISSVKRTLDAK